MGSYSGNIGRPDRTRAIVAVVAVHAALAAVILTGLNVSTIRRAVEHMTTIDIVEPPEPPPQPPPAPTPDRAKEAEGAAAKQAKPTEIVAPPPKLTPPSPVVAAPVAGSGAAATTGAAVSGSGTGAGGSGSGTGGGGAGLTEARLVRNLSPNDYRLLSSRGFREGSVPTRITISAAGTVIDCQVLQSTGDQWQDTTICQLIRNSLRFTPARDPFGRSVAVIANYRARWRRR